MDSFLFFISAVTPSLPFPAQCICLLKNFVFELEFTFSVVLYLFQVYSVVIRGLTSHVLYKVAPHPD